MVAKRKSAQNVRNSGDADKHAAAEAALRKARALLERNPRDVVSLRRASLALLDLGEIDEAKELIKRALAIEPNNQTSKKANRKIVEARLWRMVERGELIWSGGKPKGLNPPIELPPGVLVSDIVHEQRR